MPGSGWSKVCKGSWIISSGFEGSCGVFSSVPQSSLAKVARRLFYLRAEELKQNLGQDVIFTLPVIPTLTLWLVVCELLSSAASGILNMGQGAWVRKARSLQGSERVLQLGFKTKSKVTSLVLKIRLSKQWSDHSIPIPVPTFFTHRIFKLDWVKWINK